MGLQGRPARSKQRSRSAALRNDVRQLVQGPSGPVVGRGERIAGPETKNIRRDRRTRDKLAGDRSLFLAEAMSTNLISSGTTAREKVNLRTPEVMTAVQEQVESHYRSDIVDKVRRAGGILQCGDITVRLAKQFGFCYGVERAIDLAYAARKVFQDRRLFIVGDIIHNPEANEQISSLGIKNLMGKDKQADIADLGPDDVVIVPAFGTELSIQQQMKERGCQIVDTTCGDVMSVWKRVRKYASESATSIIHGKAEHEETKATSSRALGEGRGHYLVVLTLADTDYVCDYIRNGGDKQAFLEKFKGAYSPGFDPDLHLRTVGVANQT